MSFVARDFAGANVLISNLPSKSDMYGEPFVNVSLILIIIHSSQKIHLVPWFTLLQNGKKKFKFFFDNSLFTFSYWKCRHDVSKYR